MAKRKFNKKLIEDLEEFIENRPGCDNIISQMTDVDPTFIEFMLNPKVQYFDRQGNKIAKNEYNRLQTNDDYTFVKKDVLPNGIVVITHWVGIDFSLKSDKILIFETMAFAAEDVAELLAIERASTESDALKTHFTMTNRYKDKSVTEVYEQISKRKSKIKKSDFNRPNLNKSRVFSDPLLKEQLIMPLNLREYTYNLYLDLMKREPAFDTLHFDQFLGMILSAYLVLHEPNEIIELILEAYNENNPKEFKS